jgi:hypothetical protein
VEDVAAREPEAAGADTGQRRMIAIEARHVVRGIAGPALAAHVLIEAAVAVGHHVEAGHFLFAQVHRQRVDVLLAEPARDHGVQERPVAEIFGVPAGTRQGTNDGGGQNLSGGRFQHDRVVLGVDVWANCCSLCRR